MMSLNKRSTPHQGGFTLIELMMIVLIMTIALSIGVPSFRDGILKARANALAKDLMEDLQHARTEALGRGRNIAVCSTTDYASCGGNWHDGWMVFVDDGATANDFDAGEEIIRVHEDAGNAVVTMVDGATPAVPQVSIRFTSKGQSIRLTALICANGANESFARAVLVERSGRVMRSRYGASNIHVDVNGTDVSC